jgi:hypothetical protein
MLETSIKTNSKEILHVIIQSKLSSSELNWLESVTSFENETHFFQAFGLTSRCISSTIPVWTPEEKASLEQLYPRFTKSSWDLQQLCRSLLMINIPIDQNEEVLKKLAEMADIKELVCLYKGLYFLENAPDFVPLVQEGIRSNMMNVFDAIAHSNPFASVYLPTDAWNQLVLKAVFNGRPLYKIIDLDLRKNEKLALIVHDYIHERWSAGRLVSPEIWRLVAGHVNKDMIADLLRVIESGDILTKQAAVKVLKSSSFYDENKIQNEEALNSESSWDEIGAQHYSQSNF